MKKSIKSRIISGAVAGCVLLMGNGGLADYSGMGDQVSNTREVYAYAGDMDNNEVWGIIDVGENFYRIFSGENRDLVNYNDWLFFVDKDKISSYDFPTSDIKYKYVTSSAVVNSDGVNIRVGADVESKSLGMLDKDTLVDIVAVSDNGWCLVRVNYTLGFIKSEYLNKIDLSSVDYELSQMPEIMRVVVLDTESNIRSNPSADSKKLATLPSGYKLKVNKLLDNGWYEVEKNGNIGYIRSDLAHECYAIDGDAYSMLYTKNDAEVYDSPFGNKIGNISKYQSAFLYGEVANYYLIEMDGHVGYVKKSDFKKLSGTYVIVDISDQKVYVYRDNELIMSSDVVTGKDSTPTSIGLFSITQKQSPRTLVGEDYSVDVNWWMRFNGGQGLHDSTRSKFGGGIYHNKGSHGCVNLPKGFARDLYQVVSEGNKVLVKQ